LTSVLDLAPIAQREAPPARALTLPPLPSAGSPRPGRAASRWPLQIVTAASDLVTPLLQNIGYFLYI